MILLLQKGNRVVGNLSILKWCEFTMNNLEDKDIQPKESVAYTHIHNQWHHKFGSRFHVLFDEIAKKRDFF